MKTVNLSKAIFNKNCWGFIFRSDSGNYLYQNDNDLGLDTTALGGRTPYLRKVYIAGRYYAYLLKEKGGEDNSATDFKTVKALLHQCHSHVVPLTKREERLCAEYWKPF